MKDQWFPEYFVLAYCNFMLNNFDKKKICKKIFFLLKDRKNIHEKMGINIYLKNDNFVQRMKSR